MASETTKFYLTDQNTDPILGVLVRVFDVTGTTLITQDTTVDVAGDAVAEVTLSGGAPTQYTIRMSKTGVAFDGSLGDDSKSPQFIDIYSPASAAPSSTNAFNLQGQTFTRPVATDPNLCRCSGFFKDASGRDLANLDISFINQFKPAVVAGDAVLGERLDGRTDSDGYMELDLYRNGEYHAYVQSIQATDSWDGGAFTRDMIIPDRSSVNLVDLMFPVVSTITWSPASLSVAVGATLIVTPTVTGSDFRVLTGAANEDVTYASDDEAVATVVAGATTLTVMGVTVGIANLTAVRTDETIVLIPDATITGSPIVITVTS